MKNRKRIIVAFLCLTLLVVGVAYANVTGTIAITGRGTYTGQTSAGSTIKQAIKFTNVTTTVNETDYSDMVSTASVGDGTSADLVVNFTDAAAQKTNFVAKVKFTISYSADTSYPDVFINDEFVISALHPEHQDNWSLDTDLTDDYRLTPGGKVDVVVTVGFKNYDLSTDEVFTGDGSATLTVRFNYITES